MPFRFKPLPEEEGFRLGLSQGGTCPRSLAYRRLGYPGEPHPELDPVRRRLALEVGQAVHERVRALLEGVVDQEREVVLEVAPGLSVRGHIDGLIPDPETGVLRLLEVKTMAPYSWERLAKGGPVDRAYLVQVALYLEALAPEVEEALFLAVNKGDGSWHARVLPYDPSLAREGKENLLQALTLPPEEIPRPHAPDGEGRLPWQCAYCAFWRHCWPGAEPVGKGLVVKGG